jgi:hypothetical protein
MCGKGVTKAGLMSFFALWIGTSLAQEMPVQLTAEQDHQRMMALLGISSLRPGVDGSDPQAPNAANYDELKANPYASLPDPLRLKNGKLVQTEKD